MHRNLRKALTTAVVALTFGPGLAFLSVVHGSVGDGEAPHGGVVETTKHHKMEVVFAKDVMKLYAYDAKNTPLDVSRLAATVTFYYPDSPKPWFVRPLRAAAAQPGQGPASLDLNMDLSRVPTKGAKVTFEITGLPDPEEPTTSVTVPFVLSNAGVLTFR
jgi:hypothetical protein